MLGVDTNVMVYAADADSQPHIGCCDWLERQRATGCLVHDLGVLYEFLCITTHPPVMRRPWNAKAAWQFVTALLASPFSSRPTVVPTAPANSLWSCRISPANLFHDAHTAILMREHGIRQICTRHTDFNQFTFPEVIDPLHF